MTRPRWGRAGLVTAGLVLALAGPASVPVAGGVAGASTSRSTCLPGGDAVRAAASAGAGSTLAHGRRKHDDGAAADTPTRSPAQVRIDEARLADTAQAMSRSRAAAPIIEVPVYAHILRTTASANSAYYATATDVANTISVLNQAYASADVHFTLAGTRYRTQNTWYRATPESKADSTMRAALHRGGRDALNLYFVYPTDQTLGWASFPIRNPSRAQLAQDGVAIDLGTVPGGRITNYNQGKTAVHEVGHWLYLLHTFEGYGVYDGGGCVGNGDYVTDTPAEFSPTSGCPASRNSCPAAGVDPIHNYMDYSNDPCMTEFTPKQIERMRSAYATYRAS